MNFPIIIYSHSSYSDVWPLILGQFIKFMPNQKIYLFTDKEALYSNQIVLFLSNPDVA